MTDATEKTIGLDYLAAGCAVTGVLLFVVSIMGIRSVSGKCNSPIIRNGWTMLLAVGACLLGLGIWMIFYLNGEEVAFCNTMISKDLDTNPPLLLLSILFSGLVCGISAAMVAEYNKVASDNKKECDNSNETGKKLAYVVLVLSGLVLVITVGYKLNESYEKHKISVEEARERANAIRVQVEKQQAAQQAAQEAALRQQAAAQRQQAAARK